MSKRHSCFWPGCDAQINVQFLMCNPHWYRLPIGLRSDVWMHYRRGQETEGNPSPGYVKTLEAVRDWVGKYGGKA